MYVHAINLTKLILSPSKTQIQALFRRMYPCLLNYLCYNNNNQLACKRKNEENCRPSLLSEKKMHACVPARDNDARNSKVVCF